MLCTGLTRPLGAGIGAALAPAGRRAQPGAHHLRRCPPRPAAFRGPSAPSAGGDDEGLDLAFPTSAMDIRAFEDKGGGVWGRGAGDAGARGVKGLP